MIYKLARFGFLEAGKLFNHVVIGQAGRKE